MNAYQAIAELDRLQREETARRLAADPSIGAGVPLAPVPRGLFGLGSTTAEAERPYRELGIMDYPLIQAGPLEMRLGDLVPGVSQIGTFASMARPRSTWQDWAMLAPEVASMIGPGRFRPPPARREWTVPKDYTTREMEQDIPRQLGDIGAARPQRKITELEPGVETGRRISTRVPTARGKPEGIHTRSDLEITEEMMRANPEKYARGMQWISDYPSMPVPVPQMAEHAIANLDWLMNQADPAMIARSENWYKGANALANDIARTYGIPTEAAAGVLARLSPKTDWRQNVEMADRLTRIVTQHSDTKLTPKMAAAARKEGINTQGIYNKTLNEVAADPVLQRKWITAFDAANYPSTFRELTPEGKLADLVRSSKGPQPLVWQTEPMVTRAADIVRDPYSIANISQKMGEAHKIRNFYNNIIDPFHPRDITVDTHQIAASLLTPYGASEKNPRNIPVGHLFGAGKPGIKVGETGSVGTYGFWADVGRELARRREVIPMEVQSPSWELFRESIPSSKRATTVPLIENIWQDVAAGRKTAEQARWEINDLIGGIKAPGWYTQGW